MSVLPKQVLRNESTVQDQINNEAEKFYKITKHEIADDGLYLHAQGAPYPQKGFANAEILSALSIVKRFIRESLFLFSNKPVTASLLLVSTEELLSRFNEVCNRVLHDHYIKHKYLTPASKAVEVILTILLTKLGVKKEVADDFACIIAHIAQYDDAYRFRIQDLANELSVEDLMKSPSKEVSRLMDIWISRDDYTVAQKVKKIKPLISALLKLPKYKEAIVYVAKTYDLRKLRPDDGDVYWMCTHHVYNYFGLSQEERQKKYLKEHTLPEIETLEQQAAFIKEQEEFNMRVQQCVPDIVAAIMSKKGWKEERDLYWVPVKNQWLLMEKNQPINGKKASEAGIPAPTYTDLVAFINKNDV